MARDLDQLGECSLNIRKTLGLTSRYCCINSWMVLNTWINTLEAKFKVILSYIVSSRSLRIMWEIKEGKKEGGREDGVGQRGGIHKHYRYYLLFSLCLNMLYKAIKWRPSQLCGSTGTWIEVFVSHLYKNETGPKVNNHHFVMNTSLNSNEQYH